MSVLGDAVKARVPPGQLIQWTNPEARGTKTINDPQLERAVDATTLDFLTVAQVTFDETDARQIEYGVIGVIAYLKKWGGGGGDDGETEYRNFTDRLIAYAKTTSRARVKATSLSPIRQARDQREGQPGPVDRTRWRGVQPRPPPPSRPSDSSSRIN